MFIGFMFIGLILGTPKELKLELERESRVAGWSLSFAGSLLPSLVLTVGSIGFGEVSLSGD